MARGGKKEGDPLKMYTVVMALLVLVMAVLYFVIDSKRQEYAKANAKAERYMTGKGLRGLSDKPRTLPDLALAVERLSYTYEQASGGAGLEVGIPQEMMGSVATAAGLRQVYASRERKEPNRVEKYQTITQNFEYEGLGSPAPEIWRVLTLLYNIESRGRFRVNEVTWTVADPKDNPREPFDRVKKPRISVALRGPILE